MGFGLLTQLPGGQAARPEAQTSPILFPVRRRLDSAVSAPTARQRPFALPARLDELDGPSVDGLVRLPVHLDWSAGRVYDLTDPVDRRRVYELVLREGSLDDLRRYIAVRELAEQFDELVLPDEIRTAWAELLGGPAA